MNQIPQHFLHRLVEAAPWFLLGVILAAAIQTFVKREWVARWVASKRASVFNAAVVDAMLPGCSSTTVPLATSLKSNGARVGILTSLIMISPLLSPETIVLSASMLGGQITVGRIVLAPIATVLIGIGRDVANPGRRGRHDYGHALLLK